jgi:hypothetical protein
LSPKKDVVSIPLAVVWTATEPMGTLSRKEFSMRSLFVLLSRSPKLFLALLVLSFLVIGCGSSPTSTPESDSSSTLPSQSTPTSDYPQFKTFYYGSYIEYDQYSSAPGGFHIWVSSEDDQGNVSIEAYFDYSTHHCSGNVTTDGQLTLHCNYISIGGQSHTSTFHGSISSAGHITGTETADDGSDNLKWDVS